MKSSSLKLSVILICIGLFNFNLVSQDSVYTKSDFFTIVSYNVENLFDTIDDPNKLDNEFLPDSAGNWNTEKYNKKIKDLSFVISSINKNELPELVGLVEIENSAVLNDLINSKFLQSGNYAFIQKDSPDERGIDVALLYRKEEFRYLKHEIIPVFFEFEPDTKTRDILYVKGKLENDEILHVFVNHWSSRRDGQDVSEPKRFVAAKLLRHKTDSILKKEKQAKIIIMGDFNDEPTNKSLHEVLGAGNNLSAKNSKELYNLMFDKHMLGMGTYNYRGNWNMLDNLVVSRSLLHSRGKFAVSTDGGQIYQARWMMWDNVKTGDLTPNRTYSGTKYLGGVSDHLPVYVILKK